MSRLDLTLRSFCRGLIYHTKGFTFAEQYMRVGRRRENDEKKLDLTSYLKRQGGRNIEETKLTGYIKNMIFFLEKKY